MPTSTRCSPTKPDQPPPGAPDRGRIFDRNGVPLARNSPTYRVLVVREQTTDLRATLEALAV